MKLKNHKIDKDNRDFDLLILNASSEIDTKTGLAVLPQRVIDEFPGIDSALGTRLFEHWQKKSEKNMGAPLDLYPNGKIFYGLLMIPNFKKTYNVAFFQNRMVNSDFPQEAIIKMSLGCLAAYYFQNNQIQIAMEHPGAISSKIDPSYQHISDSVTLFLGR